MPKSDHDRIKDLESRVGGNGAGGGTVNIIGGTSTPTSVSVDGDLVGTERIINFATTGQIAVQGFDDPTNQTMHLTFSDVQGAGTVGDDDVGAGQGTGVGYALTSTAGDTIDLNQDMVIPAGPGQLIMCLFDAKIIAGTGAVYLDLYSVLGNRFASATGITGTGWTGLQTPASTTLYKNVQVPFYTDANDIDPGTDTATLRWMYRLSATGGSPQIISNDVDGHLHKTYVNFGTQQTVAGQNTGVIITPPPPPPPATSGAVTSTSVTAQTTLSSASSRPVSGDVFYQAVWLNIAADTTTVSMSLTDTFGDSGGSTWATRLAKSVAGPGGTGGAPTISIVRSKTGSTATGATISPSLGGVPSVGNLVVVCVTTVTTTTPPTNWVRDVQSNNFSNEAILSHVVDGTTTGDSTGNYTMNLGSSGVNAVWAAYEVNASVGVTWAIDKTAAAASGGTSQTSHLLTPGTTTVANEIAFFLCGHKSATPTNVIITPGTGGALTNDFSHVVQGNPNMTTAHKTMTSTTALSSTTFSWTTADTTGGFLCATYSATPTGGGGSSSSANLWLFSRTMGSGAATGHVVATRNAGTFAQAFTMCPFELSGINEVPVQSGTVSPANVSSITQTLTLPTSDQVLIAMAYNQTTVGSSTTISAPTQGGTWTVLASATDSQGGGYALAYDSPFTSTSFTWGNLVADATQSPAGFIVVGASAAPTAPPGTESWDVANTTASITQDLTWVQRTI